MSKLFAKNVPKGLFLQSFERLNDSERRSIKNILIEDAIMKNLEELRTTIGDTSYFRSLIKKLLNQLDKLVTN